MDADGLVDLFAPLGPVRVKRMFGGKGVYLDGRIIAVELSSGDLYLKGDEIAAPAYEAAGGRRWLYDGETKAGARRSVAMPYWTMPEAAFDDEDELRRFGAMAREVAIRADAAKSTKARKSPAARKSNPAKSKTSKNIAEKAKKNPAASRRRVMKGA